MAQQPMLKLQVRSTSQSAVSPQHPKHSIHHETDCLADAMASFCARHPEYRKLALEAVEQVMATYRTPEEHETLRRLKDEGVPVDRRCRWSDDA